MTHRLVVYYLCPIEGGRRKFVRAAPTDEEVTHYLGIAEQIAAGARFRSVGLFGFAEESTDGLTRGPVSDWIVNPGGLRAVRVEQDPAEVQGQLMEVSA